MLRTDFEQFADRLRGTCQQRGLPLAVIGHIGPDRFPLYAIDLPGRKDAGAACISAGIHGDERSGPFAVLEFLATHRPGPRDAPLLVFPCLNPHGFDRNTRRTSLKRDPNRRWTDREAHVPMHGKVKRLMRNNGIRHFLSLHEDRRRRFYLYAIGRDRSRFYRSLLAAGRPVVPVYAGRKVYRNAAEAGLVMDVFDGSLEEWAFRHGAETVACVEAPDLRTMDVRIRLNLAIMRRFVALART